MHDRPALVDRMISASAVLMITTFAVFVQAYLPVKIAAVSLFVGACAVRFTLGRSIRVPLRLLGFYVLVATAGVAWGMIGLLHRGNFTEGVFDALRLYGLWSAVFVVLFALLRTEASADVVHRALVLSGILISLVNLFGVADQFFSWSVIPESVRMQMELYVGINEGYVQINSVNIGVLFVIVPYLLTLRLRQDAQRWDTIPARFALGLTLVLTVVSGRRALMLVVALVPFVLLLVARVTSSLPLLSQRGRRLLFAYCVGAVGVLAAASSLPESIHSSGFVYRLQSAFSSQDERSIQKGYLLDAFAERPLLGSGFGAFAGYLRSYERPWTYELTYHRMLFNLGLVGTAVVAGIHLMYFGLVASVLRRFPAGSASAFSLIVALVALLIGAWSNPYLGSFDFLFFLGLLPYLSTFTDGFAAGRPEAGAPAPVGAWSVA